MKIKIINWFKKRNNRVKETTIIKEGPHGKVINITRCNNPTKHTDEKSWQRQCFERFSHSGELVAETVIIHENNNPIPKSITMIPKIKGYRFGELGYKLVYFTIYGSWLKFSGTINPLSMVWSRQEFSLVRYDPYTSILYDIFRNKMLEMQDPNFVFDMDGFISLFRILDIPEAKELASQWDEYITNDSDVIGNEGMRLKLTKK